MTKPASMFWTRMEKKPFDTVLLSAGMKARIQEVERLRQTDREFITVGDCIKPGKILQAVSGGYFAGKNA